MIVPEVRSISGLVEAENIWVSRVVINGSFFVSSSSFFLFFFDLWNTEIDVARLDPVYQLYGTRTLGLFSLDFVESLRISASSFVWVVGWKYLHGVTKLDIFIRRKFLSQRSQVASSFTFGLKIYFEVSYSSAECIFGFSSDLFSSEMESAKSFSLAKSSLIFASCSVMSSRFHIFLLYSKLAKISKKTLQIIEDKLVDGITGN